MPVMILLPGCISGNQRGSWLLHGDQDRIIQGIAVELCHRRKIGPVVITFKDLVHTLLQLIGDLFDLLLALLRRRMIGSSLLGNDRFCDILKLDLRRISGKHLCSDRHHTVLLEGIILIAVADDNVIQKRHLRHGKQLTHPIRDLNILLRRRQIA